MLKYGVWSSHVKVYSMRALHPTLMFFVQFLGKRCMAPFFIQKTVMDIACLDTIENWIFQKLENRFKWFLFPAERSTTMLELGRSRIFKQSHFSTMDRPYRTWRFRYTSPLISPNLSVCDFILWGLIKYYVYVPSIPVTLAELKIRITATVEALDTDMLTKICGKFDYRIDICHAFKGGHIDHN